MTLEGDQGNIIRPQFRRPDHAPSAKEVERRNKEAADGPLSDHEAQMLSEGIEFQNAEDIARGIVEECEQDPLFDAADAIRIHPTVSSYSLRDLSIILRELPNMKERSRRYAYAVSKHYLDRIAENKNEEF